MKVGVKEFKVARFINLQKSQFLSTGQPLPELLIFDTQMILYIIVLEINIQEYINAVMF